MNLSAFIKKAKLLVREKKWDELRALLNSLKDLPASKEGQGMYYTRLLSLSLIVSHQLQLESFRKFEHIMNKRDDQEVMKRKKEDQIRLRDLKKKMRATK